MKWLPHITVLIALLACDFNPAANVPVAAAQSLARKYSLPIHAAGHDCRILLVHIKTNIDPTVIESIHYGTGEYRAYDGGIQQFAEDERFRAVVYRDASGELRTYGATTLVESKGLRPCE